jgi:hypothetical protein
LVVAGADLDLQCWWGTNFFVKKLNNTKFNKKLYYK